MAQIVKKLLVNGLGASGLVHNRFRSSILKSCGIRIEEPAGTRIFSHCYFSGLDVTIGAGSFVNTGCFFQADAPIVIGRNCSIAMQVMFSSSSHEIGKTSQRAGNLTAKTIRVEDGCWIGTRSIILSGVTIGTGCIIAAGSVVTKDCAPNGLYGGVPAKRLRDLESE